MFQACVTGRLTLDSVRERSRMIVALGLVAVLAFGFLSYRWVLSPAQDDPQPADAVVMLAGGRGERLELARELMDDELAPVLVVMNGLNWSKGRELCTGGDPNFEVICPSGPGDTRGEAREIRDLAEARGWESIVLVTSDFHLHRAATNVGRCFDGTVYKVAAENSFGIARHAQAVVVEWGGTLRNAILRSCD